MTAEQVAAERYNNTWWRSRPRAEFPTDPMAHEHRRDLLAALVGTTGYGRSSTDPVDDGGQAPETPAQKGNPEPSEETDPAVVKVDEPMITEWTPDDWTKDELITEIEFLIDTDSPTALAERLGVPMNRIIRRLIRAGRRDLARPFQEARAS